MEPKIALIIQFAGVSLITVLMLFLHRSLKTAASKYWTIAWASLSCALFALGFANNYAQISKPLFGFYFFGEYLFGLMLVIGCRSLDVSSELKTDTKLMVLALAALGFLLPFAASDFISLFKFHAFLLATFFTAAFYTLKINRIRSFGWRVMRVALALLALDFFQYVIVLSLRDLGYSISFVSSYTAFVPAFDLVLEILLGFGMVIVSLEKVLQEVKTVHEKLEEAHQKLEHIAHIDPLTTAFNRHAFYGYLKKRDPADKAASGCVGFFDIDDLKLVNDEYGHTAGDSVIRAVAGAIRDLIRAEDLIYRWGGDEFFVIMLNVNAEMARQRMNDLQIMLTDIRIEDVEKPLTIGVSFGFTDFADPSDLEQSVKSADEEMYRIKQKRKSSAGLTPPVFIPEESANSVRP